jgi:TatD DNase family protein
VLSIHSRRASSDVLDALDARRDAGVPVLHWFSGTPRELARAVALGCWFSVGPAMLTGAKGRALVAQMPRDRVLTESDGPFAQTNGRPATPADVGLAADGLALVWGLASAGEVHQVLARNLLRLTTAPGGSKPDHDALACDPRRGTSGLR